jgi:tricarballylate dehydrogenase
MENKRPVDRRFFLKSAVAGAAALAVQAAPMKAQQAPAAAAGGPRKLVVVGAGIAGLSAALTAREAGASVVVLERAPKEERGGNTRFSNGAIRAVSDPGTRGLTREQFLGDLEKVTQGRTDKALAGLVADKSTETLKWLRGFGVVPYNASANTWNQGAAISDVLFAAAEKHGIEIQYGSRALSLLENETGIHGVRIAQGRRRVDIAADAVVLAAGGFEANPQWRAAYLGPGWDLAKVRGSRFNTGDGLRMALDVGAMPYGHWSGCHTTNWDMNAPDQNDLHLTTVFKRDSFNYGIIVNQRGERFLDEGEDLSGLIYAKLGAIIMAQPGRVAWQIYDSKSIPLLPPEYHAKESTRVTANTLPELVRKLDGIDQERFLATVAGYNASIRKDVPFNKAVKDGRSTMGLAVEKSNWATTIDTPPFEAYGVTTGITFTFGGVKVDLNARVLDVDGQVIPGLYAAGEMIGGLFYFNYPGGSGLSSSSVMGRIAGATAARSV